MLVLQGYWGSVTTKDKRGVIGGLGNLVTVAYGTTSTLKNDRVFLEGVTTIQEMYIKIKMPDFRCVSIYFAVANTSSLFCKIT